MIIILHYLLMLHVFQIHMSCQFISFDILCFESQDREHRSRTSGEVSKHRHTHRVKNKAEGKSFLLLSALNNVTRKEDEYVKDNHIPIFVNFACLSDSYVLPIHFFRYFMLRISRSGAPFKNIWRSFKTQTHPSC